ncbi:hypothetical protein CHS0354_028349 [Potamilus streckersoni]|uniref:General vesicular transport factor p115 n=1 Tax=Potamilus streckersoni TaxID=2493646 RepID=A0AAE0RUF6_9BIVA|nr:hypothetical protein CHS0354_028349 [Potamilus streckersoni]
MDYFRKYLSSQQGGVQPTGAETVERLCDRASSSTLLDDRRDAVRALKALSKKFRVEVGTRAMDILVRVLETDRSDAEITGYALDTLCHIMSDEATDDDEDAPNVPGDLGAQFTEIFIKKTDNVTLLLSLLAEYDFHILWPTVRLLTVILTNKCKDVQDMILVSPMGVSKLMDLLSESREIIRNDALLLLIQLVKNNANIQKIVAFENAFERLLEIITQEGSSDGGIVVEDCLLLLLNLLRNNSSNQNFFRESSCIKYLTPFFDVDNIQQQSQGGWSAQKVTNIHLMLQLVRTLVSPNNPQQLTSTCQKNMHSCGLLQQLCAILMASGVPADVLTETINTVSEVIRGSQQNQEYFASVMAPSNPPRPAIVVLLMSMVNEKQPFSLRCAVLYCFQSFLYRNEVGQSQIVQTLLPTSVDANTISAGQLLCGGLFSPDSLSNWFAAVALLHAILGNITQKEQLLRVQLATSLGNPPVTLLQQCCNILAQGGRFQTRIGLLMLLSTWLADSPIAVSHFLYNTSNVPYMISQVSASDVEENESLVHGLCAFILGICVRFNDDQNETFTMASLRQVIERRIGLETFTDKLNQVPKHECYTRAIKNPHINYKQPSESVFDHEFTKLFKKLEGEVLNALSTSREQSKKQIPSLKEHESIVTQYKDLIQEQDQQLQELRQQLEEMKVNHNAASSQVEKLGQQVQQLKDQNALLKVQKGSHADIRKDEEIKNLNEEIISLKTQLAEKDSSIEKLKTALAVLEVRVPAQDMSGEEDKENNPPSELEVLQTTMNRLNTDLYHVRVQLAEKESLVSKMETERNEAHQQLEDLKESRESSAADSDLANQKIASLTANVTRLTEEKNSLQDRIKKSNEENLNLLDKIKKLEEDKDRLAGEKLDLQGELDTVKKEQEDLLVLLADQDNKIDKYKARLRELGQEVEDDDDDEELDNEDVGDEGEADEEDN